MTTHVDVTVLICTRDRPGLVLDVVRSVLHGDVLPNEILVVAQGTAPTRLPSSVHVIRQSGRGLSRARNLGFAAARNDIVAILDDDMLVEPDWLSTLLAGRQSADDVATGRVLARDEPGRFRVPDAALIMIDEAFTVTSVSGGDVVPGAGVVLPRGLVTGCGGYDERLGAGTPFGGAEDNDLGFRMLLAGCTVRHVPDAVAWHRGRPDAMGPWRTHLAYGTGQGGLYAKHAGVGSMRRRLFRDSIGRVGRAVLRAPSDPRGAASDTVFALGVTTGFIRWWLTRQDRRPNRIEPCSPAERHTDG